MRAEAPVVALVRGVVAQDVLLREVGGDLGEGAVEVARLQGREDGPARVRRQVLHAALGGQRLQVGVGLLAGQHHVLDLLGLHGVDLTVGGQRLAQRVVEAQIR